MVRSFQCHALTGTRPVINKQPQCAERVHGNYQGFRAIVDNSPLRFGEFHGERQPLTLLSTHCSFRSSDSIIPSRSRITRFARAATSSSCVIMTMVLPLALMADRHGTSSETLRSPASSTTRTHVTMLRILSYCHFLPTDGCNVWKTQPGMVRPHSEKRCLYDDSSCTPRSSKPTLPEVADRIPCPTTHRTAATAQRTPNQSA